MLRIWGSGHTEPPPTQRKKINVEYEYEVRMDPELEHFTSGKSSNSLLK